MGASYMSANFTLAELTHTNTGLPNFPGAEAMANLVELTEALEKIRAVLGHPMRINSAYRSQPVNAAARGAHNSAHMRGLAADFTCPAFGTPHDICLALIDSGIAFDQLILEKTWVHVAIGGASRGQVLTCVAPKKYIPGLHKAEAMA